MLCRELSPVPKMKLFYTSFDFSQNSERTVNQVTSVRADLSRPPFPVLLRDTLRTRMGRGVFELSKATRVSFYIKQLLWLSLYTSLLVANLYKLHCNVCPPSDTYAPVRRTHSIEWDIHTRSSGSCTLTRVAHAHSNECVIRTSPV